MSGGAPHPGPPWRRMGRAAWRCVAALGAFALGLLTGDIVPFRDGRGSSGAIDPAPLPPTTLQVVPGDPPAPQDRRAPPR